MKRAVSLVLGLIMLVAAGCASLTTREQHALTGGAIGAAGGAVLGAFAGSPAIGAALGGAAGTAAGALWQDITGRRRGE